MYLPQCKKEPIVTARRCPFRGVFNGQVGSVDAGRVQLAVIRVVLETVLLTPARSGMASGATELISMPSNQVGTTS